jgi:hypothetical protein
MLPALIPFDADPRFMAVDQSTQTVVNACRDEKPTGT